MQLEKSVQHTVMTLIQEVQYNTDNIAKTKKLIFVSHSVFLFLSLLSYLSPSLSPSLSLFVYLQLMSLETPSVVQIDVYRELEEKYEQTLNEFKSVRSENEEMKQNLYEATKKVCGVCLERGL